MTQSMMIISYIIICMQSPPSVVNRRMRDTFCAMVQEWVVSWFAKRNRKLSAWECSLMAVVVDLQWTMIFTPALASIRRNTRIDSAMWMNMNNLKGAQIKRSFL